MFPSTLPAGTPELMRISDFRRYLRQHQDRGDRATTRLSSLSPSLLQDLMRFEREGQGSELLEVIAAALRHGRNLLIHLGLDAHVIPLTVFPVERLVHAPLPPAQLQALRLEALEVLQVEPALLEPPSSPGGRERALVAEAALYGPLGALTWALALRGARETLLPELHGSAAYRVPPGADLRGLDLGAPLHAAIVRLQRGSTNLKEMATWPGLDRALAARLVNALYLQSALIVSRTHPAATNEGWRSHPDVS